ncbi:MAG: NUDIX hydrolase [Chloroflexi bacterium]|nr:NUDIX hydrolase [Chloroflexota bacterium]
MPSHGSHHTGTYRPAPEGGKKRWLECAQRELREETGYRADKLEQLGKSGPRPAFSDELMHVYLATGLRADPAARRCR